MSEPRIRRVAPPPPPPTRPSRFGGLALWLCAAAGLYLSGLPVEILLRLGADLTINQYNLLTNLSYYLIFLMLPLALLTRRRPGMFMAYRPNPISLFSTILIAITALVGVFFFNGITVLWCVPLQALGLDVSSPAITTGSGIPSLLMSIFTIAVLPGVCEEFAFRGVLLSSLEPQGTRKAIVVSSLLFALLHGSIVGLPAQFLLGMVMAVLVVYCNSIYAGLIYHTTHNAASVIIDYINSMAPVDAAAQAQSMRYIDILGGIPGLLILIVELIFMGLLLRFSLRSFRLRAMFMGIRPYPSAQKALSPRELVVLLLGLLLVIILYCLNLAQMMGVL